MIIPWQGDSHQIWTIWRSPAPSADPFLYVNGMDPRGDVLAVGVSAKRQIPYTPSRTLDERIDNPDDDGNNLYGNLYLRGKVVIPVKAVDVGIDGASTIDADLNGDGNNFYDQIDSNFVTQLVNGDAEAGRRLKDAITDLGIGVNGKLSLGFAKAGIGIELPVGSAAAMFKGDRIAFSGGTVNPFAGTFLEDFNPAGTVDISGYFDEDLNFAISASISSGFFVRCNTRARCESRTETSRRISQPGRRSPGERIPVGRRWRHCRSTAIPWYMLRLVGVLDVGPL